MLIRSLLPDHHPVEQREAATQPQQMAAHARPPRRHGQQEEGESRDVTSCLFHSCVSPALLLSDHQPLPASRRHRNGGGAEPGRGHGAADQRGVRSWTHTLSHTHSQPDGLLSAGELRLPGVAQLPGPDRRLSAPEPLLGPAETRLGLHVQMDQ